MKISTDVILILHKIAECVSREITTQEKLDFLAASNDFKEFIQRTLSTYKMRSVSLVKLVFIK